MVLTKLKGQSTEYSKSNFPSWSMIQPYLDTDLNLKQHLFGKENHLLGRSLRVDTLDSAAIARFRYHWILYYDFFTTLTAIHTINNSYNSEPDNLYGYYNLDVKSNLEFRKVKWDLYLFNDYGMRYFFDSITIKTQDQLTIKNQFYYPIFKSKVYLSISANTQTQLFNSHRYRSDTNGFSERFLYDGFMSPGVIVYSGGLTYEAGGNAILHLGLGSSKVTKVRNQKIFDTRNEAEISGVSKGERKKSEWGLSLSSTVPLQHLSKQLHWEFYEHIFVPLQGMNEIRNYNMELNNVIHLLLLKYVRLSLRTKVSYNYVQFAKPVIQNQLSLGFYLSNHL
jgi:hypothetical protein